MRFEDAGMKSSTAERSVSFVDIEDVSFVKVRSGLDYWYRKRGTRRYPARSDIEPSQIKALLPNVTLIRVLADGADYEFRIVGERTIEEHGTNPIHWHVSQLDSLVQGYGDFMRRLCDRVRSTGEPVVLRGSLHHVERGHRRYESIYLPLGVQAVDHILNVADYMGAE